MAQLDDKFYRQLAVGYGEKRDMLCDALKVAGLIPSVPEGAYYVLADATLVPGGEASGKARALLAQTGVASVPGSAFYGERRGDHLLRFCFGKKKVAIAEACDRLRSFHP